jgi:hypothetical protein
MDARRSGQRQSSFLIDRAPWRPSPRSRMITVTGKTSGSVNRSSSPESVRYMSVTTVAQRRLLTDDDRR